MTEFGNKDFSFSLPDKWIDRSVIMWTGPAVLGKVPPNFAVSYDQMQPDDDLLKYANRQIDSLRAALKDWQLIEQISIRIGGREALSALFSWNLPQAKMMQRQSFVALDKRRIVSVGCTAQAAEFPAADSAWFQKIQNSFRFAE